MKLPYRKNYYVPKEKLTKYLLERTHTQGKSKANFFLMMGFGNETLGLLEIVLTNLALNGDVIKIQDTQYGRNYVISGLILTPKKRKVSITTVWTIDKGDKKPRFVTAYPLKRKFYKGSV